MALKIFSAEVAQWLAGLFAPGTDNVVQVVVGTFKDFDSWLNSTQAETVQPGQRVVMAGCVSPAFAFPLEDSALAEQAYPVPVFCFQRTPAGSASKPWVVRQDLANALLDKITPWLEGVEARTIQPTQPGGMTGIKLVALESVALENLPEAADAGWLSAEVTVRVEVTATR